MDLSLVESTLIQYDKLRYRMMPYIYSLGWKVSSEDYTMQRPLVMDFRSDPQTWNIGDQFLFGPGIMVSPVEEAKARERRVYLPQGTAWYDFWTGDKKQGGEYIQSAAPLDRIPLYVRAGSLLPLGPGEEYAGEKPNGPIELRIYPAADGKFTLHQDAKPSFDIVVIAGHRCASLAGTMDSRRRDLLKLSPLAIASAATTVGRTAFAEVPATLTDATFNVRTYGATGDGKTVDTRAINKAIEAVAGAGGGTLIFPAGTYVCFTIRLKSKLDLYLSRGCSILAADSPKPGETTGYNGGTYDPAGSPQAWEAYQDYGHNHWPNSLFYGENISDFSITGPGLIHGKGLSHGTASTRPGYTDFVAEQAGVGNKTIALKNCRNVLLRDFSVLHGGHFALLATGVDTLTIDNILVDTERDGFDIDCCHNVRVSNCTVNSPSDDAICPKSSYALGYPRTTENVTIANCFVTGAYELGSLVAGTWKKSARGSGNGRIKCGTESNGGFRNIAISNCVLEGSKGIAIESADGALVEDIAISNITLRDTADAPLFLRLSRRNRGPAETMRPGCLRRILVSNVVSYNSSSIAAPILSGIPSNLIEDVKISDCYFANAGLPATVGSGSNARPFPDWHTIQVPESEDGYPDPNRFGPTPSKGFFIRHLRNLEMSHVELASSIPDPRPAFWLEDVHRADFFAVTAPAQANFALRNVRDLRILWSRAAKDTTLDQAANQII